MFKSTLGEVQGHCGGFQPDARSTETRQGMNIDFLLDRATRTADLAFPSTRVDIVTEGQRNIAGGLGFTPGPADAAAEDFHPRIRRSPILPASYPCSEEKPMPVSRRRFLGTLGAALAGTAVTGRPGFGSNPVPPTNLLFLICDQFRADAMGHFGNTHVTTPHLDQLAGSGMVLERTYCQSPLCVPGRNSILLGRYPHSHGVIANHGLANTTHPSFPQMLRTAGYRTGCFGKLHVWDRNEMDWDEVDTAKKIDRASTPGEFKPLGGILHGGERLGQPTPLPDSSHREWYVKERVIEFMKQNRDAPWMLQCSFRKPHPPFQPPQRHWDQVKREELTIPRYPADDLDDVHPSVRRALVARDLDNVSDEDVLDAMQGYYGNIAFCDELFGEILDALDRLNLRGQTLVVFTADSGEMLYNHGLWTKSCLFEEAIRVPLILSFPGTIDKGQRSQALVEHVDLFPTFMDLLGRPTPNTVQGRSLVSLLTGQTKEHRNVARCEGAGAIAQVDHSYKFVDNGPDGPAELYDLQRDPREIENIAAQEPERVAELSEEVRAWAKNDVMPRNEVTRPIKSERGRREDIED